MGPHTEEAPLTPATRHDRPGLRARLLDALLTTDRDQRVRLTMSSLAALLMLCCIGAMYLAVASGLTPARPVHAWALVCATGLAGVYAAIRSGYSRRWKDPALTLFQNLSAMGCAAAAYVIAGPARGIVVPVLGVILMFGMFGLTPRQMRTMLAAGLAMFGLATAWVQSGRSGEQQPLALALAYLLIIAMVLLATTFLSLRIQAVRSKLRRQKAELARAVEQVRELATRDELTGLPNRRHLAELLRVQMQRAQRSGAPLLLAQLDLDHFKAINDTHGHAAGDQALRAFAQAAAASVRAGDTLARWGGEEFVLLMVDTRPAEGAQLLARLRQQVAALQLQLPTGGVRLAFSAGVARLQPGESADALLQRADAALYQAKEQGRDRVAWATGDAPE